MKNIKVELTKVKYYEFTGKIMGIDLSPVILEMLGFNAIQAALGLEIEIFGEFEIEWDDDIPMAQILNATLVGRNEVLVDFKLDNLDLDDLSELLTQFDDGSWSADKQASLVDAAHDRMSDS